MSAKRLLAVAALCIAPILGCVASSAWARPLVRLSATPSSDAASPIFGVTIDRTAKNAQIVQSLAALPERPTTRVYFEPHKPPSDYAAALSQIHRVSDVMGELLDSSDEKALSTEAFDSRVRAYLSEVGGDVDIWEIGNEVNGNWTGPYETVAAKLTVAYEDVHAAGASSALTLYENDFAPEHCGDGPAEPTPVEFSERYVPSQVAQGLSYVLLSYYPTECDGRMPDAAELEPQLEALHALYPNALLGFGEIGLPHPASKRTSAEAAAIMRWAYSLSVDLPYYVGGYFWWYGFQDALKPKAKLAGALQEAFAEESTALPR